jgi:uncharacterized integral membrane protein
MEWWKRLDERHQKTAIGRLAVWYYTKTRIGKLDYRLMPVKIIIVILGIIFIIINHKYIRLPFHH